MEITVPMAAYVVSVAALTTAMGFLVYRRANPAVPGLTLWTIAAVCQSIGITAIALRDPLPLWLSSSVGVFLSVLGTALFLAGIRVYGGRAPRLGLLLAPVAVVAVANIAMQFSGETALAGRLINVSALFAVYALLMVRELTRITPHGSRLPRNALIVLQCVSLAVNLSRAVALAAADDPAALVASDLFQAGFFLWGAFQIVARDLMLVALASQYIAGRESSAVEEVRTLSLAIEASPLSCVITNASGNIEYVNDRFCTLTGYRRDEVLGRRPSLLKSGRHPREMYADMWATITRGDIWKGEVIDRRKDGSEFTVVLAIAPMRDAAGRIARFVGIHEDITARKDLERQLVAARHAAERANQAKSEFLTSMSHELRTPLNAILGFSQLLTMNPRELLSETQTDHITQVMKAGDHLLTLINDILDLARIESGRVDLSIAAVPVMPLVEEVMALVQPLSQRAGVTIAAQDIDGVAIAADALRVKQVLVNLLSNAVKYNRPGGQVRLSCASERDQVRIAVADTGMGIPRHKQADLFTPFSRAVEPNSGIEGSGMGLVLSRQLIEAMGGTLDFQSREGEGSTFWFVLPQAHRPAPVPADEAACP